MKMTKKILIGAVAAVAMIAGFTGCNNWSLTSALQKTFGEDIFKYDDSTYDAGLGKWTINDTYTVEDGDEDADPYKRGVKLLLTKHSDMSGIIKINNQTPTSTDGVVGVAFDVTKHKVEEVVDEETKKVEVWDFMLAGVRYYNGKAQYYVSYFANIRPNQMSAYNFGAATADGKSTITKLEYDPEETTPYEIEFVKSYGTAQNLLSSIKADEEGTVTLVVDAKEEDDGSYKVRIYDSSAISDNKFAGINAGVDALQTIDVPAATIGKDGKSQAYVGVYAGVYQNKTLNATLEILELTNSAVVVE